MKPCYWITSDEPLLRIEAADEIRLNARKLGFTRHIFDIDTRFDWNEFISETQSLSLFSEKKLIECRLNQGRLNEAGVEALSNYLKAQYPDTCVLLLSPKLESSVKNTKWFKALSPQMDMQILWPLQGAAFVQFLRQRAHQYQLKLTPQALECLAENTEGNLLAAKQMLEQLRLLYDNNTIDLPQVQMQLHDASQFDVYQLIDTALAGNAAKTAQIFYKLVDEDVPPTLMLWALHRETTQLLALHEALSQGNDYEILAKQYRIFGPRKTLVQRALRRLNVSTLQTMLPHFALMDQQIKSLDVDIGLNGLLDSYVSLSK